MLFLLMILVLISNLMIMAVGYLRMQRKMEGSWEYVFKTNSTKNGRCKMLSVKGTYKDGKVIIRGGDKNR